MNLVLFGFPSLPPEKEEKEAVCVSVGADAVSTLWGYYNIAFFLF